MRVGNGNFSPGNPYLIAGPSTIQTSGHTGFNWFKGGYVVFKVYSSP